MKYHLFSLIVLAILAQKYCVRSIKTTLPVRERIKILRNQLKDEIRQQIFDNVDVRDKFEFSNENYDYIENKQDREFKITPIMDSKLHKRHKKKNTTAAKPTNAGLSNVTRKSKLPNRQKHLRSKIKNKRDKIKRPLDIFYRRSINDEIVYQEIPWAHCHYMIMPYLKGIKKDVTTSKGFGPKDPTVVRLLQLLSMNTTALSREDIYSILYQVSHLQIRLFQWDVPPIKMLLNVLIKEKNHSFRTLKHSIQTLFEEWKLDIHNASNLLKQARIFRPPCVRVTQLDGSTKSPRITIYPKKETQSTKCEKDYEDEDDHDNM